MAPPFELPLSSQNALRLRERPLDLFEPNPVSTDALSPPGAGTPRTPLLVALRRWGLNFAFLFRDRTFRLHRCNRRIWPSSHHFAPRCLDLSLGPVPYPTGPLTYGAQTPRACDDSISNQLSVAPAVRGCARSASRVDTFPEGCNDNQLSGESSARSPRISAAEATRARPGGERAQTTLSAPVWSSGGPL